MTLTSLFFHRNIFRLSAATCVFFFLMTAIAMLLYPGGTYTDPSTHGYFFFANFFSDLGATRTRSGAGNTLSMILFTSSLTVVGFGLAFFFVALTQFFRDSRFGPLLPYAGALLGLVAGLCFVGVAFTPWNLYLAAHNHFVMWAFRAFLGEPLYMASPYSVNAPFPNHWPSPFWPSPPSRCLRTSFDLRPLPESRRGPPHPGCWPKDNRLRLSSNGPNPILRC